MSIEATARVLHHSAASGSDMVVLLGIAYHDGAQGSWPSVATLAKYASISERGTQKCLERLKKAGELDVVDRPGRSNEYRITLPCPAGCDGSTNHRHDGSTPEPQFTPEPAFTPELQDTPPLNPSSPHPRPGVHPTPEPQFTRTVIEPSFEPSLIREPDPEPDRFDEFWRVYDKATEKKPARDQWAKALKKPGITAELLIVSAQSYIDYQRREGYHPKFTKAAFRWLRDERWTDEHVSRQPSQPKSKTTEWIDAINSISDLPQLGHTTQPRALPAAQGGN